MTLRSSGMASIKSYNIIFNVLIFTSFDAVLGHFTNPKPPSEKQIKAKNIIINYMTWFSSHRPTSPVDSNVRLQA